MKSDPLWYKKAVIYELYIRAFSDSNGDGHGDIPGLIDKLGYLQDLGVDCLWLLPHYPSPLRDDGYDIADYFDINPAYGTLKDFRRFLRKAVDGVREELEGRRVADAVFLRELLLRQLLSVEIGHFA